MTFDLPSLMKLERDKKQAIKGATKMEQDRWRKKNVGETMDRLDAIGTPNEKKGIKATAEAFAEHRKEQLTLKNDRIEFLARKAKFATNKQRDYFPHVKTLVDYELSYLELPPGYSIKSEITDRGIKLVLKDRFNQTHMGAFAPSGIALYDEQACRTSVNRIDDLITKLENNPPSGIYLP